MSDTPILIAMEMVRQGCRLEVAAEVKKAMGARTDDESIILWLRMTGLPYREIGDLMGCSVGRVYKIVNTTLRNTVYSIIERATCIA